MKKDTKKVGISFETAKTLWSIYGIDVFDMVFDKKDVQTRKQIVALRKVNR